MKRFILIFALMLVCSFAQAQSTQQLCYTSDGSNCIQAPAGFKSVAIAISSATTTKMVDGVAGQTIYITAWDGISSAAGTLKFIYGTGDTCGTGTIALTGTYTFGASTVISKGNGAGPLLSAPNGFNLCLVSTGSINIQGSISYAQF
jgi:hypothetical protein